MFLTTLNLLPGGNYMKRVIKAILLIVAFAMAVNISNTAYALFGKDKTEAAREDTARRLKRHGYRDFLKRRITETQ